MFIRLYRARRLTKVFSVFAYMSYFLPRSHDKRKKEKQRA